MALVVKYRDSEGKPQLVTLPDGYPKYRVAILDITATRAVALYIGNEIVLDETVIGGHRCP